MTGHHAFDQLLQMSFKKTLLERRFLQVSELSVGEVLTGQVKKLSENGLFLSISGTVDGVVWPNHYADITLRQPQKRFKEKAVVKCRVG